MSDSSNFREINEIEKEIIFQSISKISTNISQFLIRTKKLLYISLKNSNLKIKYPIIYIVSNQFQREMDYIEIKTEIYSVGLYFGFIKKGSFYLSLEGAEFLYKEGILSDAKCIYVNKMGEKSILYGNNVLKNMVIRAPPTLQKNDFLLIFNDINEIIAIAHSKVEGNIINQYGSNDVIALNLSDKGIYLRKKQ